MEINFRSFRKTLALNNKVVLQAMAKQIDKVTA